MLVVCQIIKTPPEPHHEVIISAPPAASATAYQFLPQNTKHRAKTRNQIDKPATYARVGQTIRHCIHVQTPRHDQLMRVSFHDAVFRV